MRRSDRSRRIGPKPWLIGILLVGGGLVAMFSLKPVDLLPKEWPLGIRPSEVRGYAELFDRRPSNVTVSEAEVFHFGGASGTDSCLTQQTGPGWHSRWFSTGEYADSVKVRRLHDRVGYEVKFRKQHLYMGMRRILLMPAGVSDVEAGYLDLLARDLGLIVPATSYVQLSTCGEEQGIYRSEERIDEDLLERRGLPNAMLVRMSLDPTHPDDQFPTIGGKPEEREQLRGTIEQALAEAHAGSTDALSRLMDEDAVIAWLIMAWVDGRELRDEKLMLAYQWTKGIIVPIYRTPRREWPYYGKDDSPLAYNVLTPLLRSSGFRARFEARLAELRSRIPELRERFAEVDRSLLPVLADPASLPFAQTTALQSQYKLLERRLAVDGAAGHLDRTLYFGPGHASFLSGMPIPAPMTIAPAPTQGLELDALAKQYKLKVVGDTLVFARGKYMIERTIEVPPGHAVVMLEGARLFMAPGASIVVRGELHIRGTLRNPVFIRPMNDKQPYGTIALLGDGSQRCWIEGLMISGGSGATESGVNFEGMISVLGAARTMVGQSVIGPSDAEAVLHVDGGEVIVEGTRFEGGTKALMTVDRAQGVIRDCSFTERRKDAKANGVMLTACKMAVEKSRFVGLRGTALMMDADSKGLVSGCRFERNITAIHAADLSEAHVEGNMFVGNELVFRVSKDRTQAGGHILVYGNELLKNAKDREAGDASKITDHEVFDRKIRGLFGLVVEPEPETRRRRR